jgi:hypothetical protein
MAFDGNRVRWKVGEDLDWRLALLAIATTSNASLCEARIALSTSYSLSKAPRARSGEELANEASTSCIGTQTFFRCSPRPVTVTLRILPVEHEPSLTNTTA